MNKLDEIKQALALITQGKWEWRGRIAPDWMPHTFSALDDLRVEIPTPEKDYDADVYFVLQAMKPGYVMVRNANAELIANAPEYLRALLPVVEAAIRVSEYPVFNDELDVCNYCGGKVDNLPGGEVFIHHSADCAAKALLDALKTLE